MNAPRHLTVFALVLYACAAPAATPTTGPASAPASGSASSPSVGGAGAVAADFSSAPAALKTFYRALYARDFKIVRQCINIPAPQQGNINALLDAMQATGEMQVAASNKFRDAGDKAFKKPTPGMLAAQLKAVDNAVPDTNGNTVTITLTADEANGVSGGPVTLTQVGAEWRIDGVSLFRLDSEPAAKTAERVALAKALTDIAHDVTKKIDGGKDYLTATDAYQDFWTRSQNASKPKP